MRRLVVIFIFFVILLISCGKKQKVDYYSKVPTLVNTKLFENGDQPNRIRNFRDTLYISYLNKPAIDIYDLNLNFISSIPLTHLDSVYPTSFYVEDSFIVVTEYNKNRVILYTRDGKVINSFDTMPDNVTKLFPYDVTVNRGVAYITDIRQRSVLAVSLVNAENITELGELILTIPKDTAHKIQFPSAVTVTNDGRLYVANAGMGTIDVFTCDGNYAYQFDSVSTVSKLRIKAFAYDNMIDLKLLEEDKTSFDPSGIRSQGRLHALDAENQQIHIFNPIGKYINSYPKDSLFLNPSGIAVDIIQRQIYVTDSKASKIFVFAF